MLTVCDLELGHTLSDFQFLLWEASDSYPNGLVGGLGEEKSLNGVSVEDWRTNLQSSREVPGSPRYPHPAHPWAC